MVTVEDFKKLSKLEGEGCHIFIDGDEVQGLHYDEDLDWEEFVDAREEMCCTFTFVRYTTVQYLTEYQDAEWTVERCADVNWRH
jgi:hypothetical protein